MGNIEYIARFDFSESCAGFIEPCDNRKMAEIQVVGAKYFIQRVARSNGQCQVSNSGASGSSAGVMTESTAATTSSSTLTAWSSVAVIVGVGGDTGASVLVVSPETRARPISGIPRPTANHCRALNFFGVSAPDGL